jgi:antirestriction protein ArdC
MKTDPKNQKRVQGSRLHPEQASQNNSPTGESQSPQPEHSDVHAEVTAQIVQMLESGVAPWRSPILASTGEPRNFESKKPYRGINNFLLTFRAFGEGFRSPFWLTFRQARARGGTVRQGEKGSLVVFWKQTDLHDETTGETATIRMARRYHVFNLEQCEGIALPAGEELPAIPFHPIAEAQRIVAGYVQPPDIEHRGFYAYYRPATDTVRIPAPEQFASASDYFATLYHELAHSTGHSRRLNRKLDIEPQPFGALEYGKEELIAEMAAAFLCRRSGISPAVIENQAAYIQGWLQQIRQDKKLVISAASAAQKAADWILGENPRNSTPPSTAPDDPEPAGD